MNIKPKPSLDDNAGRALGPGPLRAGAYVIDARRVPLNAAAARFFRRRIVRAAASSASVAALHGKLDFSEGARGFSPWCPGSGQPRIPAVQISRVDGQRPERRDQLGGALDLLGQTIPDAVFEHARDLFVAVGVL